MMNHRHSQFVKAQTALAIAANPRKWPPVFLSRLKSVLRNAAAALLGIAAILPATAQTPSAEKAQQATIEGSVLSPEGKPIGDALVHLEQTDSSSAPLTKETTSTASGAFQFSSLPAGIYQVSAQKSGSRSQAVTGLDTRAGDHRNIRLTLEDKSHADPSSSIGFGSAPGRPAQPMQFDDAPNFTVAGVTDWTAAGGHGSDSSLRTTEDLTRETLALKTANPGQPAAAGQTAISEENRKLAESHHSAAEQAEKRDDPLTAVHEYEQATHINPSEQNYFSWASELLLHRAVWQAQEIFRKGAAAYPQSARMITGLGTALFAGARYDEAALQFCKASDFNPADTQPYLFMGKIQLASPNPLPCIEQKLANFAQQQPGSSVAAYLYAMAILKSQEQSADGHATQQAENLLTKAVTIDPKCGDAFLELGILSSSRRDFNKAIGFYTKAIDADPSLGDAHYRLGVAYDRIGESAKAKNEFRLHDEIQKRQADAVERERREIKQFQVVLADHSNKPEPN